VVNIGNNQTVSLAELVETLVSVLGRKAILKRLPTQPGDVPQTWADVTKAGTLFGYKPKTSLPDGLRAFAEWLDANG
jgi:UDP-glucuronate 4-epimerase